jgi:hypothetical protein
MGTKVFPVNVVMLADLGATHLREERLGRVRAGAVRAIGDRVIDAVHLIVSVQAIPTSGFVGMDDCIRRNVDANRRDRGGFARGYRGKGMAIALSCHPQPTVACQSVLSQPAVLPLRLRVLPFRLAAEIGAVDFTVPVWVILDRSAPIASRILWTSQKPFYIGHPDHGRVEGRRRLTAFTKMQIAAR